MTSAERIAWWGSALMVVLFVVAWFWFLTESNRFDGNTAAAISFMTIAAALTGLLLVPALLLTGIRQLAGRVLGGEGQTADREERRGDVQDVSAHLAREHAQQDQ